MTWSSESIPATGTVEVRVNWSGKPRRFASVVPVRSRCSCTVDVRTPGDPSLAVAATRREPCGDVPNVTSESKNGKIPSPSRSITIDDPPVTLTAGTLYTITWSSEGIPEDATVEVRVDWPGTSMRIGPAVPNRGWYAWSVGDRAPRGQALTFVVTWYDPSGDVWDVSSNFITVEK